MPSSNKTLPVNPSQPGSLCILWSPATLLATFSWCHCVGFKLNNPAGQRSVFSLPLYWQLQVPMFVMPQNTAERSHIQHATGSFRPLSPDLCHDPGSSHVPHIIWCPIFDLVILLLCGTDLENVSKHRSMHLGRHYHTQRPYPYRISSQGAGGRRNVSLTWFAWYIWKLNQAVELSLLLKNIHTS